MTRVPINQLSSHMGELITAAGFVEAIRNQGKIAFIMLRDFSGKVQLVILKSENPTYFEKLADLTLESVIRVKGLVKEEKQAPGGFELSLQEFELLSQAHPELPIPVVVEKGGEESEMNVRFDWRWIDLRKPEKQKIFKVWSALEKGFRTHMDLNGFVQLYAPSIMSAPSESGAEVFEVNYFDRKAYLAQSPQFYKQAAMAAGMEKVFMTGPVFRAEPSFTTRHMTEFTGWDFEISYIEDHFQVMSELEDFIISGFKSVKEIVLPDLEIPQKPFPKISMKEAKERLKELGTKSEKEGDVTPEEERALGEYIKKETGSDFVFLTDYPKDGRAFYHMRYEDNPNITKGYDLIYKGLEIVTGAQREHRLDILERQALEKGMSLESIKDYLAFFKYGCPPHGGAGIGPGRIIMKMLDLQSVKETALFPRDVKRITP